MQALSIDEQTINDNADIDGEADDDDDEVFKGSVSSELQFKKLSSVCQSL